MRGILKKASATLGAFLTAAVWGISSFAAFGVLEAAQTTYSQSLLGVPFESTAEIDPKTTVFLYLGEAADENLRRIFNEYNRTIAEALVAAERDAYERYLAEEEAKWEEIEKAATLEHDAVFRQIEAESKTPEEKQKRIVRFYEYLGVHAPGKPSNPGMTLEEARKRAIEHETQRVYAKVYKVAIMDPRPWKRALRRAAAESWRRVEREFWPSVAEKIDWENLRLDGARFDFRPEVAGAYDSENNDVYAKFGGFFGEIDGLPFCWGIPATLEQLERTKSWREKTLRDAEFYRVFTDASFAGWTLEDCRFLANQYAQGHTLFDCSDGSGLPPELRVPGDLWRSSGKIGRKSDKIVGYDACDFTDATLRNVYFDRTATITFEQFAATRSYKEDEIIAEFGFTLAGWDFSGKNVGDLLFETGMYESELSAIRRKGGKTGWASLKLDGARFEPHGDRPVPKDLPDELSRARSLREKDLSGETFDDALNGGDFSGYDLTGATMKGVEGKLDGATIRGLKVVSSGRGDDYTKFDPFEWRRENEYGKITKERLCATKSWRDKDLRDVEFNRFYDLTGVDFSGCDLRGATFLFPDELNVGAPFFENVDFTDAKIDGCVFYVFTEEGERSWPTLEQLMSTETWKSGDLERLKTCVFPDEAQKIVDRRIFEASPEFAAKDFSGKKIEFRDMSGWDLSGLNLTGCVIETFSLWGANLTGAILDDATLETASYPETFASTRAYNKRFLSFEQLLETDNYRRKSFRGLKLGSLEYGNFSFAGIDWTNANFYGLPNYLYREKKAARDFTDAEIEGGDLVATLTKEQLLSTKTCKEGRLDYDEVDKLRDADDQIADELRAEYERLQAEKGEKVENSAETQLSENVEVAAEEKPEERVFYLFSPSLTSGFSSRFQIVQERFADRMWANEGKRYINLPDDEQAAARREIEAIATRYLTPAYIPNWEELSLDGFWIDDWHVEFDPVDGYPYYGIPATLEQLRRTKTWREKKARDVIFDCSLEGESFAGWTFERCSFGPRYRSAKRDVLKGCDFTDATLNGVYFGSDSAITFEQFAASRSFKEDAICATFGFPLAGWDFSGKNVE
ncbi:MAG: pentapeptide repeat-containing protein [Thermoguttaceae bacterium]|nr:pentapeptide repeat-containing protein [Thermoguttaceae bacterium]